MKDPQVLIAGAGPTGLVLALNLARQGIRGIRIIDKTSEPGTTSRALVVHARTLELYRMLGIAQDFMDQGLPFTSANYWISGKRSGHLVLGEIGQGLSPFPYLLISPQDEHESILIEHLRKVGIEVERCTELVGFEEKADHILARIKRSDGTEESCRAQYIAGADGAHSVVRSVLGVGFSGSTYQQYFYVADVEAEGPTSDHELHAALDDADFLAVFPMKGEGKQRIIGVVTESRRENHEPFSWEHVSPIAFSRLGIRVKKVNWFSTYHVHHRLAGHFRKGRAFILGDAAHIHSPVGAQGMNTGIGDAFNLAWKLAASLNGESSPTLLDSYEIERRAFARSLVSTVDRAFTLVTSSGAFAKFVRLRIFPLVAPVLVRTRWLRRFAFLRVSQISIHYRSSPLSRGQAGKVRGGDRLPWVSLGGGADNYGPLDGKSWQLHVYGEAKPDLTRSAADRRVPLHVFPWTKAMGEVGLQINAAYLLRPDSYVAVADAGASPRVLFQTTG